MYESEADLRPRESNNQMAYLLKQLRGKDNNTSRKIKQQNKTSRKIKHQEEQHFRRKCD